MTTEQALISAVAGLSGCVAFLFGWFRMQFAEILKKLNDCEEDREKLWAKVAELSGIAGVTKAFQLGPKTPTD